MKGKEELKAMKAKLIPIAVGLIAFLLFNIWFRFVVVIGASMENNYHNGNIVIIRKGVEKLSKGDVIIIKKAHNQKNLIKRIIAEGGDTINIDFEAHTVTVNGEILDEPYIKEPTEVNDGAFEYPVTVPDNYYFVMGDNRNHSSDSRHPDIKFIDKNNIMGKVICKLPF